MSRIRYWLWLSTRGTPPGLYGARVLNHFGSPEAAYHAPDEAYESLDVPVKVRKALQDKSLADAERILLQCRRLGISLLTMQDAAYPERLRQIEDPPCVLYLQGTLPQVDDEAAIALVGAREASPYGILSARKLGLELARCGALVISGSAQGIDTAALKGALQAGGKVISVLGNGIDVIYPQENRALYEDVARAGALLSEYPPGTEPRGANFPLRNRILAGLSLGVVVVEGRTTSGSLITARLALEQGRDVFAVPGNMDAPLSRGPNALIRQGEAKLIQNVWDILEDYEFLYPHRIHPADELSPAAEEARLNALPSPGKPPAAAAEPNFWDTFSRRESPRKPSEKPAEKQPPADPEPPKKLIIDLRQDPGAFTDDEAALLRALQGDKVLSADELTEQTGIPARRVLSAMTLLQVRQLAGQIPGRGFAAQVILKE